MVEVDKEVVFVEYPKLRGEGELVWSYLAVFGCK